MLPLHAALCRSRRAQGVYRLVAYCSGLAAHYSLEAKGPFENNQTEPLASNEVRLLLDTLPWARQINGVEYTRLCR